MSISFDSFGILIVLFNFGNLALGLGQELIKIYQDYQIKKEKDKLKKIIELKMEHISQTLINNKV